LVGATVHPNNQAGVAAAAAIMPIGSTIRNIVGAHHIGIEVPRTGLAARHAETLSPTVKRMPDSRLAGRAAICQVIGPAALVSVTGQLVEVEQAIGPAEEEQTASEAGMSRAAGEETGTPSVAAPEAPRDTTDRVRGPVAAAVPPAWDLAVEAGALVAAVVGAVGRPDLRKSNYRSSA
jgi:hypothetical protein